MTEESSSFLDRALLRLEKTVAKIENSWWWKERYEIFDYEKLKSGFKASLMLLLGLSFILLAGEVLGLPFSIILNPTPDNSSGTAYNGLFLGIIMVLGTVLSLQFAQRFLNIRKVGDIIALGLGTMVLILLALPINAVAPIPFAILLTEVELTYSLIAIRLLARAIR